MDFSSGYTLVANVFTQWPIDWIVLGAFAGITALDAVRNGPSRAAALMLALPAALLLVEQLADAFFLSPVAAQSASPLAQAAVLAIVTAVLSFVIHRVVQSYSTGLPPLRALVAGIAATIVAVIVWLQVPGLAAVWNFGDQVHAVFGEAYRFWWLAASFVSLTFVRS